MAELKDYSGKFLADVKLTDFSKEMLARLITVYAKLYAIMDQLWLYEARRDLGEKKAWAWDHEIWDRIVPEFEVPWLAEAIGGQGNKPENKETLAKLAVAYAKLYVLIDGLWLTKARRELGEEKAMAWDHEVWDKIVPNFEAPWVAEAAGIRGNKPENIAKLYQVLPDGCLTIYTGRSTIEEDGNKLTWDCLRCPSLEYHERHGLDKVIGGGMGGACGVGGLEDICMNNYAHYFNPDMKVRILKLPPRKSKDEIACTWEFTIPPIKPSKSPFEGAGKKAK